MLGSVKMIALKLVAIALIIALVVGVVIGAFKLLLWSKSDPGTIADGCLLLFVAYGVFIFLLGAAFTVLKIVIT